MNCMQRKVTLLVIAGLVAAAPAAEQRKYDPFAAKAASRPASADVIANLEFVDTPITTVFRIVSDLTGWSIMMSPEVSKQPPKINLWIKNLTPDKVLDQVVALAGLIARREGSVIHVMTFEEYCRLSGVEKRVVKLAHATANDVVVILRPFVEEKGQSRIIPDPSGNKVVLLVPQPLMGSLANLIESIDVPREYDGDTIRLVPVKHMEAVEILPDLEKFLTQASQMPGARRIEPVSSVLPAKVSGAASQPGEIEAGDAYRLRLLAEPGLNVIVLRGRSDDVARAAELIAQLDMPRSVEVVSYPLQYVGVQEAYDTLRQLVPEPTGGGKTRLRIGMSRQNCLIVAEGSPRDQERVKALLQAIDKPVPPGTGTIRVYRLENASSKEVAAVIQSILDGKSEQIRNGRVQGRDSLTEPVDGIRRVVTPKPADSMAPKPVNPPADGTAQARPVGDEIQATVIEAPEINAVVLRATAAEHEEFSAVIRELDRPRDQVMLEVTLVTVRTTKGFDLGVELAGASLNGSGVEQIGFTHFGIGQVDAQTGKIRLAGQPPNGLNYAVFNSGDFSLVLNALESIGNTRITSSPKLLVEDNAEALISLVNQEPFEITSQGESTTTTSFGGFVDAGTTLAVIPHVAKANWLRLNYDVVFSSFNERISNTMPPPRLQNIARGAVHVPADHTVVLGGMASTRKSNSVKAVPLISQIPILGELAKNRSEEEIHETLYLFIRPVILRSRGFEDLVLLSRDDLKAARAPGRDEPTNPMKRFQQLRDETKRSGK